jgi:hypothetical protein
MPRIEGQGLISPSEENIRNRPREGSEPRDYKYADKTLNAEIMPQP